MDQTITFKECVRRMAIIDSALKQILETYPFDFLNLELHFREDEDTLAYGVGAKCFRTFEQLKTHVNDEVGWMLEDFGEKPLNKEELKSRMWCHVKGFMLNPPSDTDHPYHMRDGLYNLVDVDVNIDFDVLSVHSCELLNDYNYWQDSALLKPEFSWYSEWIYPYISPTCVKLPFSFGDVLKLDTLPYHEPIHCMYLGYREKSDEDMATDMACYERWAVGDEKLDQRLYPHRVLYHSPENGELTETALTNLCGYQDARIDKITKVNDD